MPFQARQLFKSAAFAVCIAFASAGMQCSQAQESGYLGIVTNPTLAQETELSPEQLAQYLSSRFEALLRPEFRTRQAARAALLRHPNETLQLLSTVDLTAGTRKLLAAVELTTELAAHQQQSISSKAQKLLAEFAQLPTYAGKRARAVLSSISNLAEYKAKQSVVLHGGIVDNRANLVRTGGAFSATGEIRLKLDENFDQAGEPIAWIPSLKSTVTVVLEDIRVEAPLANSLAALKKVRTVIFWRVSIGPDELNFLRELPRLTDVQLNYVDIGDESLDLLATLPVSKRLRLYGTKISAEGAAELAKRLDNVEIYHGAGGFLGVATSQTDTLVSEVIVDSGAAKAGIQIGDRLTAINNVKIENFPDLRRELGKHGIGEEITVVLRRPVIDGESKEMTFKVVLGEQIPEE